MTDVDDPHVAGQPTVSGLLFSTSPLAGQEALGRFLTAGFDGTLPAPALATASILYPLPVLSPDAYGQEQPGRTPGLMRLPFAYLPAPLWVRLPFESAPVYQARLLIGMRELGLAQEKGGAVRYVSPFKLAGRGEPTEAGLSRLQEWFDGGRRGPLDVFSAVRERAKACWPGGYNPSAQSRLASQAEREAARGVLPLQAQSVVALAGSGRPSQRGRAREMFDQLRSQYAAPRGSVAASVFDVSPLLDRDELSQWVFTHRNDPISFFDWLTTRHLSDAAPSATRRWQEIVQAEEERRR